MELETERYQNNGCQILTSAIGSDDINAVRAVFARLETDGPPPSYEPEFDSDGADKRLRKLRRLLWNGPEFWGPVLIRAGAVDLATKLIGQEARAVFHAAFLKPAFFGTAVALHQDQALWRYRYPKAFSMWIALTEVAPVNGGLHGCPTSHSGGEIPHRILPEYPWHPAIPPDEPALPPVEEFHLAPGDAVVWDRYFVHGSGANTSEQDRMGMVVVFADGADPEFRATDSFGLDAIRALADR